MIPFTYMKRRTSEPEPPEPGDYDDSPFALPVLEGSLGRAYPDPDPPKWWQWFREVVMQLEHRGFPPDHSIVVSRAEENTWAPAPAYDDGWVAEGDGTHDFQTGVNFTVDVFYESEGSVEGFLEDNINGVPRDPAFGPFLVDDPGFGGILEGDVFVRPVGEVVIQVKDGDDETVAEFHVEAAFTNNSCMEPVNPLGSGNPSESSARSIRITHDDGDFSIQIPSNWTAT